MGARPSLEDPRAQRARAISRPPRPSRGASTSPSSLSPKLQLEARGRRPGPAAPFGGAGLPATAELSWGCAVATIMHHVGRSGCRLGLDGPVTAGELGVTERPEEPQRLPKCSSRAKGRTSPADSTKRGRTAAA